MENSYQETIIRFKKYKELADDISKLEKALDKACEYLEDGYSNDCPSMEHPYKFDYPCRENEKIETKEQWKEWLLNEK